MWAEPEAEAWGDDALRGARLRGARLRGARQRDARCESGTLAISLCMLIMFWRMAGMFMSAFMLFIAIVLCRITPDTLSVAAAGRDGRDGRDGAAQGTRTRAVTRAVSPTAER